MSFSNTPWSCHGVVYFPGFRIARYPITWVQYRAFVDAKDGYHNKEWWGGLNKESKSGGLLWAFASYPAINVSWFDAMAFCRWLSAKRNLIIRLPTEWEWQWGGIGNSEQDYPWGDEWFLARANLAGAGIGRTVAVGLYPLGGSPFGIDDMTGNINQWCLNSRGELHDISLEGDQHRVVCGRCWFDAPLSMRSLARLACHPDSRENNLGFRVLCESPIDETLPVAR